MLTVQDGKRNDKTSLSWMHLSKIGLGRSFMHSKIPFSVGRTHLGTSLEELVGKLLLQNLQITPFTDHLGSMASNKWSHLQRGNYFSWENLTKQSVNFLFLSLKRKNKEQSNKKSIHRKIHALGIFWWSFTTLHMWRMRLTILLKHTLLHFIFWIGKWN